MECVSSKDQEIVIDIGDFAKTSREVVPPPLLGDVVTISVDEGVKSDNLGNFSGNQKCVDEISDKNSKREKRKSSGKKPPKPPRPSSGVWLDAADQKLIKELTELAMLKRARIERMKKKAAKASSNSAASSSSSSGSLLAMIFTIIFCIVIVLQGCHSPRYSPTTKSSIPSLGSLDSSNQMVGGVPLTSIGSPNVMEAVLGSDSKDLATKAIH